MNKWTVLCAVMMLATGLTQMAAAESDDQSCQPDIKKFCADVKPGGGRIIQCLKKHDAELSEACKARGKQAREHAKETHQACKDDVQKLCKDVQPGEGRIISCLKEHDADVSQACKKSMHRKQ
ncbi:MAG: hypothetical protein HY940_07865 [Gammaproteobacteria bacterium]|nr:hypothetical protein [Gammaproteobacteria bacterium]